jgi:hypothetical protein
VDVPPAPPVPAAPAITQRDEVHWEVARRRTRTVFRKSIAGRELQDDRLAYRSDREWEVSVEDYEPASTALSSQVRLGLQKGDWKVGASGRLTITADNDWFYLEIGLEASEGESLLMDRIWRERIERLHA